MSDIIFGVVADMRREQMAWELADAVDAKVLSYDDGTLGPIRNHIKVWTKLLQHGGDWAVVLEDDAVIDFEHFGDQLAMVLDHPPSDIVGLYLGRNYPRAWQRYIKKAMTSDAHYVVSTHLLHGVGTAIRMHLLPDMLSFVGHMQGSASGWPVDEQITSWARLRGHRVAYCKPSIVEHHDGPSLIADHGDGEARNQLPRRAWEYGHRETWDWEAAVEMP